jgi:hypothetical protein
MYPIEYICTREDTISTGINIDTVNESKTNPHDTYNDSESIHENNFIYTDILFIPTSKKLTTLSIVVNITDTHAIKCEPVTPTFLPKNPEIIELSKGNIIMVKYII